MPGAAAKAARSAQPVQRRALVDPGHPQGLLVAGLLHQRDRLVGVGQRSRVVLLLQGHVGQVRGGDGELVILHLLLGQRPGCEQCLLLLVRAAEQAQQIGLAQLAAHQARTLVGRLRQVDGSLHRAQRLVEVA
jgi:hypothetical protein